MTSFLFSFFFLPSFQAASSGCLVGRKETTPILETRKRIELLCSYSIHIDNIPIVNGISLPICTYIYTYRAKQGRGVGTYIVPSLKNNTMYVKSNSMQINDAGQAASNDAWLQLYSV